MTSCSLCGCGLTEEEIELGFDVCEPCEDDEKLYGNGGSYQPARTKMRFERDGFAKQAHRPRGMDKFDSVDTRESDD